MGFQVSKPSDLLAHLVKQYWGIDHSVSNDQKYTQRIIPSGLIEMTFYFQDLPKSLDTSKNIGSHSIISGQLNGFYDIEISGKLSMFSITFKPLGALFFFDIPLNELTNQNVPLRFLLQEETKEMEDQLFEAGGFQARVRKVEQFLYNLLRRKQKLFEFNRIEHTVSLLNNEKGIVPVNKLAEEACLSRKQFERKFSAFIGLSPKQYLRIVQFQSAIHTKQVNPNLSLTDLTYHTGYYDQSHMVNNFKHFSGMTPKQYFSQCDPVSDYFGS